MFKKLGNILTPIASEQATTVQSTGQIARLWRRTRGQVCTPEESNGQPERDTDAMERLAALADGETEVLPVVKRPTIPRFIEYRRTGDNPLTLLYGAAIASIDQLGRLPDGLYLSAALVAELRKSAARANIHIGDHYKIFTGSGLASVPIHTASDLPQILQLALNINGADLRQGDLARDCIIAVCAA